MNNFAIEKQSMFTGESRTVSMNFAGKLDAGELLSGIPTVTITPAGPSISNARVNTAPAMISGQRAAIGEAVQFQVTGIAASTTYTLAVTATTNSTPAQTLIGYATLLGVSD